MVVTDPRRRCLMVHRSEEEAEKFFNKCSYCEPTDEGKARAAEIVASRMDRAKEKAEKRSESGK